MKAASRSVWVLFFTFACMTTAVAQDAKPGGYRSPLFDSWQKNGKLRLMTKVSKKEYTLTVWAQCGKFSVEPFFKTQFSEQDKFLQDCLEVCDWVFKNSAQRLRGPLKEYHFVFTDGFIKSGICATIRGTNVFCGEIRKWHERMYSRKSRKEILYISAAHEEYHLQNYMTDPAETKIMREFSAMLWESTVLIKRGGKIEYLWGGMSSNKKQITRDKIDPDTNFLQKYHTTLTRGLAYWVSNLTYKQAQLEGIESLSRTLLTDKQQGLETLDSAAKKLGLKYKQKDLTLQSALSTYRAYLGR